jgi:hypothetical protein
LDKCLNEYHDAAYYVGQTLTDHEGSFVVDKERAERVQVALDYVEKRVAELESGIEDVTVLAEKRVDPAPLVGRNDMSGTVDIQLRTDNFLEIIDYKDGINPTDAREQMEQYAVGAVADMQVRGLLAPTHIRLTVIQPKLRLKGLNPITSFDYTLGEIMKVKDQLIKEAAATDSPDAPYNPGDKQCRYCAHSGNCSALTSKALDKSGIAFANLDVAKQAADKEPGSMTDQQLREIIEAAPLIRQMIEGAEEEAMKRLKAGAVIEGLKAVRGRGSRGWMVENDEEMADKLKKFGLPKDVIWQTKLISVAQAEKATWTKRDGTVMQLSERQLKTMKSEYTKTTEGKLSVASASDPRPAVTLSAAPMFTAVAEPVAVIAELPAFLR